MSEEKTHLSVSRRTFLKTTAVAAGAGALANTASVALAADTTPAAGEKSYFSCCRGNCGSRCPQKVVVREGKVVSSTAAMMEPQDMANERRICVKGLTQPQRVYDKDRVKYPLRRVAGTERGAGQWERISWDDAMAEIATNMKECFDKYGASSVAFWNSYASTGLINGSGTGSVAYGRFLTRTGVTILGPGADWAQMFYAYGIAGGMSMFFGNAGTDVPNARTVIVWGANPAEAYPQDWQFICRAQEAGSKLITIDPQFTSPAAHSDWYLPIRPATDGALMLAMANYIMDNNLLNEAFVKNNTACPILVKEDGHFLHPLDIPEPPAEEPAEPEIPAAEMTPEEAEAAAAAAAEAAAAAAAASAMTYLVWDEVAGAPAALNTTATPAIYGEFTINGVRAMTLLSYTREKIKDMTVSKAAGICDLGQEDITKLATIYATEGPVFIHTNQGLGHHVNSHHNYKNLMLLAALTGNIGIHGASLGHASLGYRSFPYDASYFAGGPGGNMEMCGMYLPDIQKNRKWGDTPLDIHFIWIANGNPLCCESGRLELIAAVKKVDFVVCCDCSMTDSADYADIVLPIPHVYETEDIAGMPFVPYFPFQPKIIEPLYECRSDFEILNDLAKRLGMNDLYDRSAAEYLKAIINTPENVAAGATYERMHTDLVRLYDTSAVPEVDTSCYYTAFGRVSFHVENPYPRQNYGQSVADYQKHPYFEFANEAYWDNPLRKKYPLMGMNQHEKYHVHSQMAFTPWMREIEPEPFIKLNARDAEARGIKQGDYVHIFNDHGDAVLKAKVTEGIKEGVVSIPHGWHSSQFVAGHAQNLTNRFMNDYCTNSAFSDFLCEVEKYEGSVK